MGQGAWLVSTIILPPVIRKSTCFHSGDFVRDTISTSTFLAEKRSIAFLHTGQPSRVNRLTFPILVVDVRVFSSAV